MKRRNFLAVTGATAASVALAGCNDLGQDNGDGGADDSDDIDLGDVEGETGETADNLELTSSSMLETSRGVAVMGTVRNTGDTDYEFVEAEVTLNDGDTVLGEWVDTTEEELDGLHAGELWRFMAPFDGEEMYEATGFTINLDGELANGGS